MFLTLSETPAEYGIVTRVPRLFASSFRLVVFWGFRVFVSVNTDAPAPWNIKRLRYLWTYQTIGIWEYLIDSEDFVIFNREERWFERGEAIWERVEKPSLNKQGAFVFKYHMHGTNHWSIFLANWLLTSEQLQSITPVHLCSCLMKSNEIGWKFASKQTLSSIWFIILTLFYGWMIDNIHQHLF